MRQRLEARQPWHVLIEEDNVERLAAAEVEGILPADGGNYFVAFVFEKKDMGLEQIYLIISPEYFIFLHVFKILITEAKLDIIVEI